MYCNHCGTKVAPESKFCQNCGARVFTNKKKENSHREGSSIYKEVDDNRPKRYNKNVKRDLATNQQKKFLGGKFHPWRRFFARTVDIFTLGLLAYWAIAFLVGFVYPEFADTFLEIIENPLLASALIYIIWLQVEAVFIAKLGTTPAKWLFGIHVLSNNNEKLSYKNSIKRAALVWIQGEAFGIPIIMIFTRLYAYGRLTKTGTTSWDQSVNAIVVHKKWGVIRYIVTILVVFTVLIFFTILNTDYS